MANYFSVVQYLPDPTTDERINVGVVVIAGESVQVRFLKNWSRVRCFAEEDISFLKDFATKLITAAGGQGTIPGIMNGFVLNEQALHEMASGWINSIQLTPPRASLQDASALVADVTRQYLREPERSKLVRGRRVAAAAAARGIRRGLEDRLGEIANELIHRQREVPGAVEEHVFDVVVQHQRPCLAAHGISFEVKDGPQLERRVDAMAWAIADVRTWSADFPLGVVALPPRNGSSAFERARRVFAELGAQVLVEGEVEEWARGHAASVSEDLPR